MLPPDPRGKSILQGARTGDLRAFEQLVRQYQAEVFGAALNSAGDHSIASEVAQGTFVQLHAAIARIASHAHLRHWLLRTVAQRAAAHPRHHANEAGARAAPPDPGADFTARVMAHVELRWSHRREDCVARAVRSKPRGSHRGLLIATMTFAAIAAIIGLWTSGKLRMPEATPSAVTAVVSAASTPAAAVPAGMEPAASSSVPLAPHSPSSQNVYPQYTLIVLPLRHASLDANALAPAEAFHAALVTELRKVPGISLLIPGVTAPPETLKSADYLLTVTSLEARALPAGGTVFRIAGSRGGAALSAASPGSGRQWPVEITVQPIGRVLAGFTSTLQIGEDMAAVAQLAAKQMELLRVRMFPDVLVKQQLMARIRDASLSPMERSAALDDLLGARRDRGSGLDSVDISVIVGGAAAMSADERARLWRSLRGVANVDLVDALVDSMRRDPDTSVRFEALATLAADYASVVRVRAAIESVSREDPAPLMRMAAQRQRNGDAEWRRYIVTSLKDTRLPYPERLAPLLLAGQSATTPAESLGMQSLMSDAEIVNLLTGIIRDSWFDNAQAQFIGEALSLVNGAGKPAGSDLLVEIPQDSPRTAVVAAAPPVFTPQISAAAMAWLMKNRNNPHARRILDDIARGRADPQTGFVIDQMMQQQRPPRR
jgi:hypothetical protein